MTREDYVEEYAKLNKAYNQIFDTLQELMDNGFDNSEVITAVNYSLNVMDKALDVYKASYVDKKEETPKKEDKGFKGFKVFGGK